MRIKQTIKDLIRRLTGEVPTKTLVKRGLRVGTDFTRQQGCYIDPTHCFLIEIGNNVTLSIRVTLLAHDASTKKCLGFTKIGKIRSGDNVFIGANSVVTKNVPENTVVTGNPARVVCSLSEFREKNGALMENTKVFGREYRFSKRLTEEQKNEMREAVSNGIAFID